MPEVEGLIVKMKADTSDYDAKLKAMQTQTTATSEKVKSAFSNISTVAAAASVALTGFAMSAVKSSIEWGKSVDDLVDKTGMMGEEASKLLGIAKAGGVSAEEANMAFAKLSRTISQSADAQYKANQEGKESSDVFTRLGIAVTNSDGTMRASLDIYQDVAKGIRDMGDGWQKTALEMELFGRSGSNLHDMLNFTQEEIDATIKKMEAMGLVMSKEDAAAAEKLDRQIKGLTGTMTSLGRGIGNEVLPHIRELVTGLNGLVKAFVSLDPQVRSQITNMVKLGIEIGITVKVVTSVVGAARGAAVALGVMEAATFAAAGPWLALAAAIGLALYQLRQFAAEEPISQKASRYAASGYTTGTAQGWTQQAEDHEGRRASYFAMKEAGMFKDLPEKGKVEVGGGYIPPTGGGGGASEAGAKAAEKEKTAYESLLEVMQKNVDLLDRKRRMYEITQDEYIAALNEQITSLEAVAVTEEEEADRTLKIYDIRLQLQELHEREIDNQVKRLDNEKQLGELELENAEQKTKHLLNMLKIGFKGEEVEALKAELKDSKEILKSKYDFEVAESQKRIAIYAKEGEAKKEELEKEQQNLLVLAKKYNNDRAALDDDYAEKRSQAEQKIIDKNNETIFAMIKGDKSMHDVILSQWDDFLGRLVQKLFSFKQQTNIFDNLLGGIFGMGGSSSAASVSTEAQIMNQIVAGFRANGGPVRAGSAYVVGERRPELFVPDTNGTIIPDMSRIGPSSSGGGDITVNIINNTGQEARANVSQSFDSSGQIIEITLDALNRNKFGFRDQIAAVRGG